MTDISLTADQIDDFLWGLFDAKYQKILDWKEKARQWDMGVREVIEETREKAKKWDNITLPNGALNAVELFEWKEKAQNWDKLVAANKLVEPAIQELNERLSEWQEKAKKLDSLMISLKFLVEDR